MLHLETYETHCHLFYWTRLENVTSNSSSLQQPTKILVIKRYHTQTELEYN